MTGATTFQIEPELDSGPVYGVVTETIRPTDTAGDLLGRLSVSGAALLETTLDGIADGTLTAVPQPSDGITVAPKVTVDEARVRWDLPAHVVDRRIRAVTPNPGAWTMIGDLRVKLGPVTVDDTPEAWRPARFGVDRSGVLVGTGIRRRCCWDRSSRRARSRWTPRTGRAVRASTKRRARHDTSRSRGGPATQAARSGPPGGVRRAAGGVGARCVRQPGAAALLRERGITGRDAAFATELTYGTCRTRGLLDAVIAHAAGRPTDNIDPVLLDLLRLGTYQLLRTRVEPHAAVSTTVEQAGIEFDSARAGFVNGVLRTIAGRDEQSLGRRARAVRHHRPGRPPGVRARPPAVDRAGVRRRARCRGR